jgi:hypothetical protein
MKKTIFILFFLITISCYSQDYNRSVNLFYGLSKFNTFNAGLSATDLHAGFGFYMLVQGSGDPYTGETGIDYSSICDETVITDYGVVRTELTAFTGGLTYDFLLKKDNPKSLFTAYMGVGYAGKYEVSETYYYYKWTNLPKLNEGNYVTWISSQKKGVCVEGLLAYDFFPETSLNLGIIAGINSTSGPLILLFFGAKLNNE